MKSNFLIFIGLLIGSGNFSCSHSKILDSVSTNQICLVIDPYNYRKVNFSPNWISRNKISRIIEREYLDGKNGKLHLITIFDYNNKGYITTKYNSHGYPKTNTPDETNIFSKVIYEQETRNSFIIQKSKTIRYLNNSTGNPSTDTLFSGSNVFNTDKSIFFKNENNEVITKYVYDEQKRITKEIRSDGKQLYEIIYHSKNKIEIKQYSSWFKGDFSSWIMTDNQGRIISVFDESNKSTHEFKYDKFGFMIEDKHWFKDKEPNYHVYEFIKKSSQ